LDPSRVEALLREPERGTAAESGPGLAALADRIEREHHDKLKAELPRLQAIASKVVRVHGGTDPRLAQVEARLAVLARELADHMEKEERILFPAFRELEAEGAPLDFHCGSLGMPIGAMGIEHEEAAASLDILETLTDGYTPPEHACGSWRALLSGLRALDEDMAEHMRKEEEILFPRALEMERNSRRG
jgi:regulator of cell morphogenesis and NO signaling